MLLTDNLCGGGGGVLIKKKTPPPIMQTIPQQAREKCDKTRKVDLKT